VNERREHNEETPKVTQYIGECFLRIAEGLSRKPNFFGYSFREEMVMDGVENCIKAVMNYNVATATRSGTPNAFGYFTQITYYAFLRRIIKENRQQEIKERYIDHAGIESFADFGSADSGNSEEMVNRIKLKSDKEISYKGKTKTKREHVDSFEQFYD
jgi:hypothetical protein